MIRRNTRRGRVYRFQFWPGFSDAAGYRSRCCGRNGLSLLEVLFALAILVASLSVLSKLVELGVRASEFAQLHTSAILLAESKMGELVAGIEPINSTGGGSFLEDPAWQWQLTVASGPVDGLKWVSITVSRSPTGELAHNREPIDFTLSRWVMDPDYFDSLDQAAAAQ